MKLRTIKRSRIRLKARSHYWRDISNGSTVFLDGEPLGYLVWHTRSWNFGADSDDNPTWLEGGGHKRRKDALACVLAHHGYKLA